MNVDYLIIGQGISGTWLSYYLLKEDKSFVVIDNGFKDSPSRMAAGIINPVTGRRHVEMCIRDRFRALVKYRNISSLHLRVIKATETLKKQLENQYDERYWPALAESAPFKSWQQVLPSTNDLQEHSTEIKIDGLPSGEYILFASSEKDFNGKKAILGARFVYVSSISYVNSSNNFFILNRDNGQPLANAGVQVWEQKYDYNQSKYIKEKGKAYTTDANGFFKMDRAKSCLLYTSLAPKG